MVSFTGAPTQPQAIKEAEITGAIIQTQVVPPLESTLPIVEEARKALGSRLDYLSLEGYMVGKLFLAIAAAVDGPLTRENFLKAARRSVYDIGSMKIDFTNGKNPGSDWVFLFHLKDDSTFVSAKPGDLENLMKK